MEDEVTRQPSPVLVEVASPAPVVIPTDAPPPASAEPAGPDVSPAAFAADLAALEAKYLFNSPISRDTPARNEIWNNLRGIHAALATIRE